MLTPAASLMMAGTTTKTSRGNRFGKVKLVVVVLAMASSCCAQSLGDVAKQSREQSKKKATKTITNEDLPGNKPVSTTGLDLELAHVKQVLHDICVDPKTNEGRILTDSDKQAMEESVKPLRVRVNEYLRIEK